MIEIHKTSRTEVFPGAVSASKLSHFVCICLVFYIFNSLAAFAEAISGTVLDSQGASIGAARVWLYTRDSTTRLFTTTRGDGHYEFARLVPGEYFVEADARGFALTTSPPITLERGADKTYDLTLSLERVSQEVAVTASSTAQSVDEVSKALTVVDRQEIQWRDEYSVAEALRTVPGLRFQQLGGPGALTSLKIRGLRNEDTAILIDGQRLRDAAAPQGDASGLLSDLLFTNSDRLEVLHGSGSSLYGTNAIGGVVNIITDEGGGQAHGSVLAEGGSLGFFRGVAQFAGGLNSDRVAYSLGVGHLNVTRGVDGDDAARNTSGQGKILFRLTPSSTLSARLFAVDSFQQINSSPFAAGDLPPSGIVSAIPLPTDELRRFESGVPIGSINFSGSNFVPSANDPDFRRTARFLAGTVTFSKRARDTWGYSLSYQGLNTDRSFLDGPGGVLFQPLGNSRADYDGRLQNLSARTDFRLGSFNLVNAGYEFENERYVNRNMPGDGTENSSVDVTQRSSTLYIQDQLRLWGDRLQVMTGFRYQGFSLLDPKLNPSTGAPYLGLSFSAPPSAFTGDGSIAYLIRSSGTKLRAHVGNGYRAPSLYERFGTYYSSFGYSAYGDPRLRPDRSIAYDAGIDQTFWSDRIRGSVTYFYTRLQEIIIFDFSGAIEPVTDPFGRFGGYRNSGGGLSRGVEFSATLAPARSLSLMTSYTYTNADQRQPIVADILRSFVIPNHQLSLVVTKHFGQRLFVNFNYVATSNYLAPLLDYNSFSNRAYQFDGVRRADAGVSYQFPLQDRYHLRAYVKLANVFNQDYYEAGYRTPRLTAISGLQFEF